MDTIYRVILMLNSYGKYEDARNASWNVLINRKITSLPVSVVKICRDEQITLAKNSTVKLLNNNEFAKTILINDKWYIIYDDSMSKERIRFSIAHELGHIFLGHQLTNGEYRRTFVIDKPSEETQADIFASRLLAPAVVLWALDIHSAEEIQKLCFISYSASKIRAERMKLLYSRNKFLISQLETRVYNQFKGFILKYKEHNS